MAKKVINLKPEDIERMERRNAAMELIRDKNYEIFKADIKDGRCNYKYYVSEGTEKGNTHGVDSEHLYEEGLANAFKKFNVHFAAICGAFHFSKIEIDDIDKFHDHDLTELFEVTGFEIGGTLDTPKIKLVGSAYIEVARTRIEIKTKNIVLDNLTGYQWYNELLQAAEDAKLEVALYKEGFYIPDQDEDEQFDDKQGDLFKQGNGEEMVDELEAGKV
jgi:hypothetical protein